MGKPVLIYGSQDFAQVVRSLVEDCGLEFVGLIDDYAAGDSVLGTYAEVLTQYPPAAFDLVIAIGYNNLQARWSVYQKVITDGYETPALIHDRAYVSSRSRVEAGAIVMAGAIVDTFAKVQELAVLWPGVVVNHDSVIGANTFLSPNSTVCGFTQVGHSCFIGAGAVVVDHRTVPDQTFVKAGCVYK
jgi:sugar O-acyltransferase (sialic acid O-acetyltransferase NeuD family)